MGLHRSTRTHYITFGLTLVPRGGVEGYQVETNQKHTKISSQKDYSIRAIAAILYY